MLTVSLIAGQECLDPTLPPKLSADWLGGDVLWLSPEEAAEFELAAVPEDFETTRDELARQGVDLLIQNSENRRKKLLLADMDSTMIEQECLDELADEAGVGAQVADITARAMNGDLPFEDALRERVALLAGQPVSLIQTVLNDRLTLMPGGRSLVATMRANGAYTALVSGGFTVFSGEIAQRLGFDEHRSNTLGIQDDQLTGTVIPPIFGRSSKLQALRELTKGLHIGAHDVLAVGDGANDLDMLGRAGSGVALHAKPAVQAQCDLRINNGDLSALLFLQGYSRDHFVT